MIELVTSKSNSPPLITYLILITKWSVFRWWDLLCQWTVCGWSDAFWSHRNIQRNQSRVHSSDSGQKRSQTTNSSNWWRRPVLGLAISTLLISLYNTLYKDLKTHWKSLVVMRFWKSGNYALTLDWIFDSQNFSYQWHAFTTRRFGEYVKFFWVKPNNVYS